MSIEIKNVNKFFGNFQALDNVNLHIGSGELVALLGPSGSGKTTLLRVIAGLEHPEQGQVFFNGFDTTLRHVSQRGVGYVFQHYALFRHMSVFENVAYGLRVRPKKNRPPEESIRDKVLHLLRLVQLEPLAQRFPEQLSGGQRQRVALARALAVEPQVLLLDEPFGALDARVRAELRDWLRKLHDDLNITSLFVTHDQEEAMEVADRVVILNHGRIVQAGSVEEIYHHPVEPFVYEFLGNSNRLLGQARFDFIRASEQIALVESHQENNEGALAYVRPHDLEILLENVPKSIAAVIERVHGLGNIIRLQLRLKEGGLLSVEDSFDNIQNLGVRTGQQVFLRPRRVQVFVKDKQDENSWFGLGSNI